MAKFTENLSNLIKAGELDITTREAVEDELEKARREAEPAAFALTYEESRIVIRAMNVLDTLLILNDDDDEKAEALLPNALESRGIKMEQIVEMAERVYTGNWYTFLLSSGYRPANDRAGFVLDAYVDGKNIHGILPIEDFPAVYDPKATQDEKRVALGLPENAKFIPVAERDMLGMFREKSTVTLTPIIESAELGKPPREIAYPKAKVVREYFENRYTYNDTNTIYMKMNDGQIVQSQVDLSLVNPLPGVEITSAKVKTPDHDMVYRIVCSYWLSGQREFTDAGICKSLYQANTPEKRDYYNGLIIDMMNDVIKIDMGSVGSYYGVDKWTKTGHVLPIEIDELTATNMYGERKYRRYRLTKEPIYLSYSQLMNQIARYSREALDTPVNKTPDILALHFYLLERIDAIPNLSRVILYDTLFEHLGINSSKGSDRNKRSNIRTKTRIILNDWKKRRFIKGWHEETADGKRVEIDKDGKAKRGVSSYCIVIEGIPKLNPSRGEA